LCVSLSAREVIVRLTGPPHTEFGFDKLISGWLATAEPSGLRRSDPLSIA
jgi:hypothetical protein